MAVSLDIEGAPAMKPVEPKPDAQGTDSLKELERFVVENDDLLAIESRIGRFNIFDALSLTHVEIRHSNFLAFILDPAESHGQGQLFLKGLLMDLLKSAPAELRPLSPIDLDGTDLRGVEVRREWKNIDLLITCKEPRFAVVIENKIGSHEHSNQLSRYQATMRENYPDLPALYVYLTPDADEPSDESWVPYSYADIHRVFERVRETYRNAIGDDILVFLDHYLNLLGTRFMNDEKVDELCRRIYKNHRQALDLIWERVGSPKSAAFGEVVNVVEADVRWRSWHESTNYISLQPKIWLEWLPPFDIGEDKKWWFLVDLRHDGRNLRYSIWVGPMEDATKRKEIITKLRDEIPKFGFERTRAREFHRQWSRISANERVLEWGEDEEPEPDVIRDALKKALDELYSRLEKMTSVLKRLCNLPTSAK
jgi:PD-(D/E)XK nuclease superfamily